MSLNLNNLTEDTDMVPLQQQQLAEAMAAEPTRRPVAASTSMLPDAVRKRKRQQAALPESDEEDAAESEYMESFGEATGGTSSSFFGMPAAPPQRSNHNGSPDITMRYVAARQPSDPAPAPTGSPFGYGKHKDQRFDAAPGDTPEVWETVSTRLQQEPEFERMLTSVQRHKGGFPTDVQFAEVNDKERLLSLDEWQSKYGHMQDEMNPRSQGEPGGNKLVRRRGQLMALAVQAQENDAMLKAKWAENRAAKKAAAMRYGF